MRTLLFIGCCFLLSEAHTQVRDVHDATHTPYMLRSNIRTTAPARDTLKQYSALVHVTADGSSPSSALKGSIYNNTTDTINIPIHGVGRLLCIQEALDEQNKWLPIEYFSNDRCGNSFSDLELPPQYTVSFYLPWYTGDFKTKLRLRIKIGSYATVVFSNEWEGVIDKRQFEKPAEACDKDLYRFYDFLTK